MRDYAAGALEALSWVDELLEEERKKCNGKSCIAQKEVETALRDLHRGVAVDFRRRLTDV